MKQLLEIINQISTLEQKLNKTDEHARTFNRMKRAFEELGYIYNSPTGEVYSDTRTDVEATIVGEVTSNLKITKVIKPIIIKDSQIVQRGVVIVEELPF